MMLMPAVERLSTEEKAESGNPPHAKTQRCKMKAEGGQRKAETSGRRKAQKTQNKSGNSGFASIKWTEKLGHLVSCL
jgi:hypothetical protein